MAIAELDHLAGNAERDFATQTAAVEHTHLQYRRVDRRPAVCGHPARYAGTPI
jgi:hypothetical protein